MQVTATGLPLASIDLPDGFEISIYAKDLPGARSMTLGTGGVIFVGTRTIGSVYAVQDRDGDGIAERKWTLEEGLDMPNGVAFRDEALYVAENSRVIRYDQIISRLDNPPSPTLINAAFPNSPAHGWKFIAFGPDGLLYVPVGAPCNCCLSKDSTFASICRMKPDGTNLELFASGVRNTVGFDWHPITGELWFTDNGRDGLGDDIPSDELNRAPRQNLHFGFPFIHANGIADPDFGQMEHPVELVNPEAELGAHVAALGMRFYTGSMFPERYRNGAFIAEHGSWNRSSKVGYRVVFAEVVENRVVKQEVFASGWLKGESVTGRPVDVLVMPDGSLLVSDDKAGAIYRITYSGK